MEKSKKGMSSNIVIGVIVLLVVGFLIYQMMNKSSSESNTMMKKESTSPTNPAMKATNVKEFTVVGSNFKFDLKEIKVRKGDTVKITFKNVEGFHDWVVDEFNAKTSRIKANEVATVEFVADKVGTFEYYCSVMKHRAMGMKGNLIVE